MPERKHYVITRRKRSSQHPPGSNNHPNWKETHLHRSRHQRRWDHHLRKPLKTDITKSDLPDIHSGSGKSDTFAGFNQLNSNAKYSKYSASLIQSQRIEESTVKEITFYKFGRLVSVFINISIKAFHPSTTDFVDICDIPDDYLPRII